MAGKFTQNQKITSAAQLTGSKIIKEKFATQSMMIGRKPRVGEDNYKTALISLFNKNNPHKCGEVPVKTMEYPNIEKVRLKDLINVSYYLEGNDLVINDLENVEIEIENSIITVRGKQKI